MTQFQSPPPVQYTTIPPAPPRPPLSGLAIGALVCSLLFFIPFLAPTLGLVLGIIAVIVIATSQGRQRGMGMAVAAIVIAIPMFVGHVYATKWVLRKGVDALEGVMAEFAVPVERFIVAVEAGDFDVARGECTKATAAVLSDDVLAALKKRLAADLGTFEKARFDWTLTAINRGITPTAGAIQPTPGQAPNPQQFQNMPMEIPIKLDFSGGTLHGLAVLMFEASATNQTSGGMKLHELKLVDASGLWTIPAASATTPPASPASTQTGQSDDTLKQADDSPDAEADQDEPE